MKKLLLMLFCVMLLIVGCASAVDESSVEVNETSGNDSSQTDNTSVDESSKTEMIPKTELEIDSQYIRTNYYSEETQFPSTAIINSREELEEYCNSFDKTYSGSAFINTFDEYDSEYFNDNYLVFIRLQEGSGSISHKLAKVVYDEDKLDILINRHEPFMQTCDMAEWHFVLEINKKYAIYDIESINIKIENAPIESIKNTQMDFAVDLFKQAYASSQGKNVLVSPLSAHLALAMTANGADGNTLAQMEDLLCGEYTIPELNEYYADYFKYLGENNSLKIANSIWIKNENSLRIDKDFIDSNEEIYKSEVYQKPFDDQTATEMNEWVKKNTDGMIEKIINEISPDAKLYIVNALCFEDEWRNKYGEPFKGEFTTASGSKVEAEMMSGKENCYIETETAKGFVKSYKSGRYEFVAVLPNEDISIDDYIASLTAEEIYRMLLNTKRSTGYATIAKFESDFSFNMNNGLKELGMTDAFSSSLADFSKIGSSTDGNLFVSNVLQKTFIQVDTNGTKAAAATSVEVSTESVEKIDWTLEFNRPFVYMIVDNETDLPVFIGVLNSL